MRIHNRIKFESKSNRIESNLICGAQVRKKGSKKKRTAENCRWQMCQPADFLFTFMVDILMRNSLSLEVQFMEFKRGQIPLSASKTAWPDFLALDLAR